MTYTITMEDVADKLLSLHRKDEPRLGLRAPQKFTIVFDEEEPNPDFFFWVLRHHFRLSTVEAHGVMVERIKKGRVSVGEFSLEVAEQKVIEIDGAAIERYYKLRCRAEPI